MTTTIIKSIGTAVGRDYATLVAFFAAIPANLVAVDQKWIGEVYNDSEIVSTTSNTCLARTTDATRNIILRAATGQGFAANATAATNPLIYDPTKGAAIRFANGGGAENLYIQADYTEIRGLQLYVNTPSNPKCVFLEANYGKVIGNIIKSDQGVAVAVSGAFGEISQNVLIQNSTTGVGASVGYSANSTMSFNTVYAPNGSSSSALACSANFQVYPICQDNAIFGFTTPLENANSTSSNNATDAATMLGSANLTGLVFANTFQGVNDLRLKSTSVLIGAGVAVAGQTTDILVKPLANPPSIGCYAYSATAGSGDTTPPTMNGAIAFSAITFSGFTIGYPAATDNLAVTGYEVSTDGGTTYQNVGNVLTVVKSGLTANTLYSVKVRAYDAALNKAAPLIGTVTTLAAPVTTTTGATITTSPLCNNTGTLLASQAGWKALVHNVATGALVATVNSLTTSATATLTITDPAMVAATTYRVILISPSLAEGMKNMVAA